MESQESLQFSVTSILEVAVQSAYSYLMAASKSDNFLPTIAPVFNGSADLSRVQALSDSWASGDFSQLPTIQVLPSDSMNGANGAFSEVTRTIYLSSDYLAQGLSNPDVLTGGVTGTLLEEIGHFVDTLVNPGADTAGDEGALFAATLMGLPLSNTERLLIHQEDDHSFVTIDGKTIAIEQSFADNTVPVITVADNETPVITVAATDTTATETTSGQPPNPGQFTLTRTGDVSQVLTVNYALSGTATNGTDYSNLTGIAVFAAGSSQAVIDVHLQDDTFFEGMESLVINLVPNNNYTLGENVAATVNIKPYLETQGNPADYEFLNRIIFKDTIGKYTDLDIDPNKPGNDGIKTPSGEVYYRFLDIDDPVSGFQAVGFISESGAPPVLVFNGTNPDEKFGKDILDDLNAAGVGTNQFSNNIASIQAFIDAANKFLKDSGINQVVDITGYSLGGANAQQAVAYFTNLGYKFGSVVTFNSPGISVDLLTSFNSSNVTNVTHYIVNGDIVSLAGQMYLPGNYQLVGWDTKADSGLSSLLYPLKIIGDKHNTAGSEKFYLSNYPDFPLRDEVVLNSNFINKEYLSSPSFSYWAKPTEDWTSLNIILGILSKGEIPPLLASRATVEASRATLGTLLAPVIEALTTDSNAIELAKSITEIVGMFSGAITNIAANLTSNTWAEVSSWSSGLWGVVGALFSGRYEFVKDFLNTPGAGISDVANALYSGLGLSIDAVATKLYDGVTQDIGDIAKGLYNGVTQDLGSIAGGLYNGVTKNISSIAGGLYNGVTQNIGDIAKGLYNGVTQDLGSIAGGLYNGVTKNIGSIAGGLYNGVTQNIGDIAKGLYNGVTQDLGSIAGGLYNGVTKNIGSVAKGLYDGVTTNLGDIAKGLYSGVTQDLGSIAGGLYNGVTKNIGSVAKGLYDGVTTNLGSIAKGLYSGVTQDLGSIAGGLYDGITKNIGSVAKGLYDGVTTNLGSIAKGLYSGVTQDLGSIAEGLYNGVTKNIGSVAKGLYDGVTTNLGSIAKGLYNGVTQDLGSIAGGLYNGVTTNLGSIARGLYNGVTSNLDSIAKGLYDGVFQDIDKIAKAIIDEFGVGFFFKLDNLITEFLPDGSKIRNTFINGVNTFREEWLSGGKKIETAFSNGTSYLRNTFINGVNTFREEWLSGGKKIETAFSNGTSYLRNTFINGVNTFKEEWLSGGKKIETAFSNGTSYLRDTFINGVNTFKEEWLSGGKKIETAFSNGTSYLRNTFINGVNTFKEEWLSGGKKIETAFSNGTSYLRNTFINGVNTFKEEWLSGGKKIETAFSNGTSYLRDTFINGVQTFKEEWLSGGKKIETAFSNGTSYLRDTFINGVNTFREEWLSGGKKIETAFSNGTSYLRDTFINGVNTFREEWLSGGKKIETAFSNGTSYLRNTFINGVNTFREEWLSGGKKLETSFRNGTSYLRNTFLNGKNVLRQTWESNRYIEDSWDSVGNYLGRNIWDSAGNFISGVGNRVSGWVNTVKSWF